MRFLVPALATVLLAACADMSGRQVVEHLPARGDVRIEGPVTVVDTEAMHVDGDGRILVRDADYGTIVLRVPARRQQLCAARYEADIATLAPGVVVRARGEVAGRDGILICARDSHYLRRVD